MKAARFMEQKVRFSELLLTKTHAIGLKMIGLGHPFVFLRYEKCSDNSVNHMLHHDVLAKVL